MNTILVLDVRGQCGYQNGMNRIKEIRESRGLSQEALAKEVETSQPQIRRLENGERSLTEKWMRKIAEALDVHPADLLTVTASAGFTQDIKPVEVPLGAINSQLKNFGLYPMEILTDAVERSGNPPSQAVLVDRRQEALDAVRSGDVVVAAVYHDELPQQPTLIVRQFLAPSLLTTNRNGSNISVDIDSGEFKLELWGVLTDNVTEN
jgi:transcriptional regulator with XRE-family HTH domain